MIVKYFDLQKKLNSQINLFLFYGENQGLIEETIENDIKKKFSNNLYVYNETDILSNKEQFQEKIFIKSFFENDKLIIINNVSDKILILIEEIFKKKILDIKIILIANKLEKKSKLRSFFEKKKDLIIVPFYEDNFHTLHKLAQNFFYKKKIKISSQNINLLVEKTNGQRQNLKNELEKISNYLDQKKSINLDEINKLINQNENSNFFKITDYSLAKDRKRTLNILNESLIASDENILIIKTFLNKLKRLKKLKEILKVEKNVDKALDIFKPPIFWKEKDIVKQQLKSWSTNQIIFLVKELTNLEILIKKNLQLSNILVNDFIFHKLHNINNKV